METRWPTPARPPVWLLLLLLVHTEMTAGPVVLLSATDQLDQGCGTGRTQQSPIHAWFRSPVLLKAHLPATKQSNQSEPPLVPDLLDQDAAEPFKPFFGTISTLRKWDGPRGRTLSLLLPADGWTHTETNSCPLSLLNLRRRLCSQSDQSLRLPLHHRSKSLMSERP